MGGGFKIRCFYCKTFNVIYPQDPDYMRPLSQPCHIGMAAVFLASEDSSYITGTELFVDGGMAQV